MDEQLQQQLWDYAYGLLTEAEAEELELRIGSEPDVARAYAEVRLKADMLGEASRVVEATMQLGEPQAPAELTPASVSPFAAEPASGALQRRGNWFVAAAASLVAVVALLGAANREPQVVATSASAPVKQYTEITMPPKMEVGARNSVLVRSMNAGGEPEATQFLYRILNREMRSQYESEPMQASNIGAIVETPPLDAEARFFEVISRNSPSLRVPIRTTPRIATARVTPDRSVYRPGDTVRFQLTTLSRHSREPVERMEASAELRNGLGETVAATQLETDGDGVVDGELTAPNEGGDYKLIARNEAELFKATELPIRVRGEAEPETYAYDLEFARDSYRPGEAVTADLKLLAKDGEPASADLRAWADIDGVNIPVEVESSAFGESRFLLTLPERVGNEARLNIRASDGRVGQTIVKTIPVAADNDVIFLPEGGRLVAGVMNRVFFVARSASDQWSYVRGTVRDDLGNDIVAAEVAHEGRGSFLVEPKEGRKYTLFAGDETQTFELPQPEADGVAVIANPAVFDVAEPVRLLALGAPADADLLAVAECRGVTVGQKRWTSVGDAQGDTVRLDLAEDASGVIRVTILQRVGRQWQPKAERLVYRHPSKRLDVAIAQQTDPAYSDSIVAELSVVDENGEGRRTVLNARAEPLGGDDSLRRKQPGIAAHFGLASELYDASDIEDIDLALAPADRQGNEYLELILGVDGWRRFMPVEQYAGVGGQVEAAARVPTTDEAFAAPITYDNRLELTPAPSAAAPGASPPWRTIAITGCVLGLFAILMMGLLRMADSRVCVPAFAMASVVLVSASFMQISAPADSSVALSRSVDTVTDNESDAFTAPAAGGEPADALATDGQSSGLSDQELEGAVMDEATPPTADPPQAAEEADAPALGAAFGGRASAQAAAPADKSEGEPSAKTADRGGAAESPTKQLKKLELRGGFGGGGRAIKTDDKKPAAERKGRAQAAGERAQETLQAQDKKRKFDQADNKPGERAAEKVMDKAKDEDAKGDGEKKPLAPRVEAVRRSLQPKASALKNRGKPPAESARRARTDSGSDNAPSRDSATREPLGGKRIQKEESRGQNDPAKAAKPPQAPAADAADGDDAGVVKPAPAAEAPLQSRLGANSARRGGAKGQAALSRAAAGRNGRPAANEAPAAEDFSRTNRGPGQDRRYLPGRGFREAGGAGAGLGGGAAATTLQMQQGQAYHDLNDRLSDQLKKEPNAFYRQVVRLPFKTQADDNANGFYYWMPKAVTDDEGKARLVIPHPPGAPAKRLVAEAFSEGRLGDAETVIAPSAGLLASFSLPKSITYGDEIRAPITLYNNSAEAIDVDIELAEAEGLQVVEEDRSFSMKLKPGEQSSDRFIRLRAEQNAGVGRLAYNVRTATSARAVKETMRIDPQGYPVDQYFAGVVDSKRAWGIVVPKNQPTEISLQAFPTVVSELQNALAHPNFVPQLDPQSAKQIADLSLDYLAENKIPNVSLIRAAKGKLQQLAEEEELSEALQEKAKEANEEEKRLDRLFAERSRGLDGKAQRQWLADLREATEEERESFLDAWRKQNQAQRQQQPQQGKPAIAADSAAAIAMQGKAKYAQDNLKTLEALIENRQKDGGFGDNSNTLWTLRALTANAGAVHSVTPDAKLSIGLNGTTVATKPVNMQQVLEFNNLERFAKPGANELEVNIGAGNRAPFLGRTRTWTPTAPAGREDIELQIQLSKADAKVGDSIEIRAVVANTGDEPAPLVADVRLPGGMFVRTERLAELKREGLVDHFETSPSRVKLRWRAFPAKGRRELVLDAVAGAAGRYTSVPSSVFRQDDQTRPTFAPPMSISID